MKTELFHSKNLNLKGRNVKRFAVRGIIFNNNKILMIHSEVNGDYKFPGGGIKEGESHDEALKREILEECGLNVEKKGALLGELSEFRDAYEDEIDYFKMESFYYKCSISSFEFQELSLDPYEEELKFRPKWISINDAIIQNKKIINSDQCPKWTKRDTHFLEYLNKNKVLII